MAIGRRGFMKSAAVAGSLLALGASSKETSSNSRINVAIVGCRNRGSGVMKSMLAYSEPIRPVIPIDSAHPFRGNPATLAMWGAGGACAAPPQPAARQYTTPS